MASCYYAVGETGIRWAVTMKTMNAAGDEVVYEARARDAHYVEFRRPSGDTVRHAAAYDGATGEVSWDQGGAHADLLDEPGAWSYRGVLVRADGETIKTGWAPRFWVVP